MSLWIKPYRWRYTRLSATRTGSGMGGLLESVEEVDGWAPAGSLATMTSRSMPTAWCPLTVRVYPLSVAGGPRARWTFPDGVFEQVGHAASYADGPWWHGGAALVVYLIRGGGER